MEQQFLSKLDRAGEDGKVEAPLEGHGQEVGANYTHNVPDSNTLKISHALS